MCEVVLDLLNYENYVKNEEILWFHYTNIVFLSHGMVYAVLGDFL